MKKKQHLFLLGISWLASGCAHMVVKDLSPTQPQKAYADFSLSSQSSRQFSGVNLFHLENAKWKQVAHVNGPGTWSPNGARKVRAALTPGRHVFGFQRGDWPVRTDRLEETKFEVVVLENLVTPVAITAILTEVSYPELKFQVSVSTSA